MKHACNKDKTRLIILKRFYSQNVAFYKLQKHLKLGYYWLHICRVMIVFFCFTAAEGARKLMKPNHILASPGKNELLKSTQFPFLILSIQSLY